MNRRHLCTIVEALRGAANEAGERSFVNLVQAKGDPIALSFADVWEDARRIGAHLAERGLKPGDPALVLLPTGRPFVATFFGVQLAGGTPVPVAPPFRTSALDRYLDNLRAIVASSRAKAFVTTPDVAEQVEVVLGPGHTLVDPEVALEQPTDAELPGVALADAALIQYTSGTTSEPRGVVLSHRAIAHNVTGIAAALDLDERDVAVSWLPMFADMGLIGMLITALYARFPLYVMRPEAFLIKPQRWLETISTYGGTISCAPNFAYKLCTRRLRERQMEGLDLSSWRIALNGAEAVEEDTVRAFADKFAPVGFRLEAFTPTYGLAENTLAATFHEAGTPYVTREINGKPSVACGKVLPGTELAILDANMQPLPDGTQGEICVRGGSLMDGYNHEPEATAAKLRGGWLHTGDKGVILDGQLFITGRIKEMIIKFGRNYYPVDIEGLAARAGALSPDHVVAFAAANDAAGTEDLVVVVEAKQAGDAEACKLLDRSINTELLSGLGIKADRMVFTPPGTLPRDPGGRVDRAACRERWSTPDEAGA